MKDTPKYIKDIQLKIWLEKSPGERLYQFLVDNDKMYQGILVLQKKNEKKNLRDVERHQQNEKLK
ncbi:MAG: hypothetical protein ABI666_05860 [Ferruginibacter sp.]